VSRCRGKPRPVCAGTNASTEFHRITRAGLLLFTTVAVVSYLTNGSFSWSPLSYPS